MDPRSDYTPTPPTPPEFIPNQPSTLAQQPNQPVAPQPPLPQPQMPPQGQPPKNNRKKLLLITIGAILFIATAIGAVIAIYSMSDLGRVHIDSESSKKQDESESKKGASSKDKKDTFTANYTDDFSLVCKNMAAENALPFKRPVVGAYFTNNVLITKDRLDSANPEWRKYGLDTVNTGTPNEKVATSKEINAVICLDRDDSTAVKYTTCQLQRKVDSKETAPVDYYSVQYKMTLYEANTGKKVKEFTPINGNAEKEGCPVSTIFDPDDPKFYAMPDVDEINTQIEEFNKQ